MLEILKSMIIDFQETQRHTGVPRLLTVETVSGKVSIYIGVRRAGKSTYLYQLIDRLFQSGISSENILYLNFFDDRLHHLGPDHFSLITEAYFSLYPQKKNSEKIYCFFDEIQVAKGWESFIDRLLRTEKCEIHLTGSSARMLSREIATQMRGRGLAWEIFPFSFQEYLDSKGVQYPKPISTKQRLLIQRAFEAYCETGGFPEVVSMSPNLRIKTHQEYFQSILFRDLIERYNIPHARALVDLAHWLMNNIASLYSVNNLTGYLKSLGHKVPKSAVAEYLEYFEDAYCFFTVRIFDASVARRNTNPKKIYCIDHSLVYSVSSGILLNRGHLLENMIFIGLRRRYADIYYYKTKSGREVDFVVPVSGRDKMLVQVTESLADPQTQKRETTALFEAMAELKVKKAFIVTRGEDREISTANGKITVLPAWRFLLDH